MPLINPSSPKVMLLPDCLMLLSQTDVYQRSLLTIRMTGGCHVMMPLCVARCSRLLFLTRHLSAHFTQTRSAVVFKRLEFLPGFYKVWNTWLCGWKGRLCGKHISVENTEVITPGLSDTKNLCVSTALYCRVWLRHSVSLGLLLQGSNELWKFNMEMKNILM